MRGRDRKIFAFKGNDRREISSHREFKKRPAEIGPINGVFILARLLRREMRREEALKGTLANQKPVMGVEMMSLLVYLVYI